MAASHEFSQASEHDAGHAGVDDGLSGAGKAFEITGEPAEASQPCKGALNHPAPWSGHKAGFPRFAQTLGDLDLEGEVCSYPVNEATPEALIYPEFEQGGEVQEGLLEQLDSPSPLVRIGFEYFGFEHQPQGVGEDETFASLDPLVSIKPAFPTLTTGLGTLAIYDPSGGLGVFPGGHPYLHPEAPVDPFPSSIQTPHPEVVVGGLPGHVVGGHQPPGTASSEHVENSVQDQVPIPLASGMRLQFGQQGLQHLVFLCAKIAGVVGHCKH